MFIWNGVIFFATYGLAYQNSLESAVVATLVKARDDKLESDDRSASSLAFESGRSHLCKMHSRSCISKVEKEILSLTTPASGMKALAQIGAWHNSLDRMAVVILVSPLLNYFFYLNY